MLKHKLSPNPDNSNRLNQDQDIDWFYHILDQDKALYIVYDEDGAGRRLSPGADELCHGQYQALYHD